VIAAFTFVIVATSLWIGRRRVKDCDDDSERNEQDSSTETFGLTTEQISTFLKDGVLVVPNVLTPEEVANARIGLHSHLLEKAGVDVTSYSSLERTSAGLRNLSSTNGSGGVLDIFYAPFKLQLAEHPAIFRVVSQLWRATFAQASSGHSQPYLWSTPYGSFDPDRGFAYIDRVGFRVPSSIAAVHAVKKMKLQRSLTPHLDCCPHDLYASLQGGKTVSKWRPIQCFVALTPTPDAELGGFEAAPGFHRDFEAWAHSRAPEQAAASRGTGGTTQKQEARKQKQQRQRAEKESGCGGGGAAASEIGHPATAKPPCVGEFTPVRAREDAAVLKRIEHVPCMAGDLVLWDNRIPHANSRENRASGGSDEKERLWGAGSRQTQPMTPQLWSGSREVVYLGFLPDVPLNRAYALAQRGRFENGELPDDQWREQTQVSPTPAGGLAGSSSVGDGGVVPPGREVYGFSPLGRRLMAIDPWG